MQGSAGAYFRRSRKLAALRREGGRLAFLPFERLLYAHFFRFVGGEGGAEGAGVVERFLEIRVGGLEVGWFVRFRNHLEI